MTPNPKPIRLLILGLGNLLCGDDGLGAAVIARLRDRYEAPDGVSVLDGGTLGLALLPYLEDSEKAILVDAIRTDDPPGSHVRLEGDDVGPAVALRLSPHQVGVADLLDAARWRGLLPDVLVLLGLVPKTIELGLPRSPRVEEQVPELTRRVVEEARMLGFELTLRRDHEAPAAPGSLDVARALGL